MEWFLRTRRKSPLGSEINYLAGDFEAAIMRMTGSRCVQFVLDSLGGYGLRKGMRCLGTGGHCVTIGAAGVVPPTGFGWRALREWRRIIVDLVRGGVYHPFKLLEKTHGISGVQILLLWDEANSLQPIVNTCCSYTRKALSNCRFGAVYPLDDGADVLLKAGDTTSRMKV